MKELPARSTHPDMPIEGYTIELAMKKASWAILRAFDYKGDHALVKKREAALDNCDCTNCLGVYAQTIRWFVDKWRVPDEEKMNKNIDTFRCSHP